MKRIAFVFLISILIPALLLAALAIRSVRDQEVVLNNQKALVHQATCDTIAADINLFLDDVRVFYSDLVDELAEENGAALVNNFPGIITDQWSQASVGVTVSDRGEVLSPQAEPGTKEAAFLENNGAFFGNEREVEVYQAPQVLNRQVIITNEMKRPAEQQPLSKKAFSSVPSMEKAGEAEMALAPPHAKRAAGRSAAESRANTAIGEAAQAGNLVADEITEPTAASSVAPPTKDNAWKVTIAQNKLRDFSFGKKQSEASSVAASEWFAEADLSIQSTEEARGAVRLRTVNPSQKYLPDQDAALASIRNTSRVNAEALRVNEITGADEEGAVSRLVNGELHILLWRRPPSLPGYTFWTELDLRAIRGDLEKLFAPETLNGSEEVAFALLDTATEPIALSESGFAADWAVPFVASEVGQLLPRWEVAAYLLDPDALNKSAETVRLTLWLIVVVLLGAVGIGGALILKSINYEMKLASRKTDFVGNVSHELKTPLTSIRMFSELLAGNETRDPDQTRNYSEVISRESARLTRLINRLLDFSRLDRGEMKLRNEKIDLGSLVKETVAVYHPETDSTNWNVHLDLTPGSFVKGDRDSLSQVIWNLLSNAEKYAPEGEEVLVEVRDDDSKNIILAVHDRGEGISSAHQRKIFEKFYRVDDSIDSGVEGSGIGLALCRQIIEQLGGTITYRHRSGGGSTFIATLPKDET